ncbi:LacI family transcriptional regulator [Motilibacter rhizosphaerae]|uniref:LacI family transcriptional regulator n=1 Tax=Motilibacter rhizosphaerae TaxID=598652 RepID=A0A4Q7NVS6_9ACTN|nr:substrate-binding domain-containing protein [Motilibacter rhizosphaerae]RZS91361.1 LacI family transcriptional regulator [Motilibacter rhizosphaerae]
MPPTGAPAPTLADVARLAAVTVPTVSKVLNGRSDVSDATRRRVLAAVAEVGYAHVPRRRRAAAPPPDPATTLVDLVVNGVEGSWANRVLGGVEDAAREADHDVVVTLARPEDPPGRGWVDRLVGRRSRGAVLALFGAGAGEREALAASGIPVVLLDPDVEPPEGVPSVGATNWSGGRSAATHLLGLGHRRLAVISGGEHLNSRARVDGFRSAVDAAAPVVVSACWSQERAEDVAHELLASADRPTGVFACSDVMARGVYQAAARLGLRIPDDLSVVGFDDLPEASWLVPGLTTVRQPVHEMAATALRLLLRLQGGSGGESTRIELATSLVVRGSTAAPVG